MTEIPKDFPWRAGMRILPNEAGGHRYARILTIDDGVPTCIAVEMPVGLSRDVGPWIEAWNEHAENDQDVPDLTDPATLGALEQPVREAWNDPALYAVPVMDEERDGPIAWSIRQPARYGSHERGRGVTRGEAWLAAWNARPVPK